jgi:AcrR family transcriptional regulator
VVSRKQDGVALPSSEALLRLLIANRRTDVVAAPTRDLIVRNAIRLFAQQGYAGTSMRMIASACDIKAASIYEYFDSKESLLFTAVTEVLGQFQNHILDNLDPDSAPIAQLEQVVRQHVTWQMRFADLAGAWDVVADAQRIRAEFDDEQMSLIDNQRGLYRELVIALVAYTSGRTDADAKALAIMSLCDRVSYWNGESVSELDAQDRTWALSKAIVDVDFS